jgi:hypothetical protein
MKPKTYLMSKGHLSQLLQRSPKQIDAILDAASIAPEVCINGVDHYGSDAYMAVSDHLERQPPKEIRAHD